ncbi:MAG: murein transglycosylase domain-containing protein [Pseudomonadota bacterium]
MTNMNRTARFFLALVIVSNPAKADHIFKHKIGTHTSPTKQTDTAIQQHKEKIHQAYNKYKEKAAQVWGSEAVLPDAKTDVTYRDGMKQRSIVDYEKGSVQVELALKPRHAEDHESVTHQLATAVEKTLLQGPDNRSIIEVAENPTPPESNESPVLDGLVAKPGGNPLTTDEIRTFKIENTRTVNKRALLGKDGEKRVIISTKFNMVPDHIKVRAKKFSKSVDHYAHRHNIPAPLVYAIMETESYFNPRAKSSIPAFGLMQLVPATGARDAYKFLFQKDIVVKESYLYKPEKNIELGVAYLHLLYFRYFIDINDPVARQWATVAAYNTGAQNVIKSFLAENAEREKSEHWIWKNQAIKKINSMRPEQVFNHLRNNLPTEETRNYVTKVRERIGKYTI